MLNKIILLLIIAFSFEASGQDYFFRQYTNEEGYSGSHEVVLMYNFRYIVDVVNPRYF